jgi:hypothetical protein
MKWQLLQMPEDTAELAPWLDRQLVGLHLRELVSEFTGIRRDSIDSMPADTILGEQKSAFLAGGLAAIDEARFRQVLTCPTVLFDLQDMAIEAGGSYWTALQRGDAELQRHVDRGQKRVQNIAGTEATKQIPVGFAASPLIRWYYHPVMVSLATAAVLLIAFLVFELTRPTNAFTSAVAWGWAKPGALPEEVSANEYFSTLADSASAWFNQRPEDAPSVARRIAEFRQGCTTLLLANHAPLNKDQQQWLRGRCRIWADKIDTYIAEIESGADPLQIRTQMDATVNSLIIAFRDQASSA